MSPLSSLLEQLNPEQRQAALHEGGPAMVMAGAGSGKTRVLTTRVAWLIDQGVPADDIMLVTFTNKASQEMSRRVVASTGQPLTLSGTFHRIAARILRRHGQRVELPANFVIFDSDDQLALLKQIYKDHGISQKEFAPRAIKAAISKAKNELISWQAYGDAARGAFQEQTARAFKLYQRALNNQNAVDFDDLLTLTAKLLQEDEVIRRQFQERIQHVLIDEYQDTNRVQYVLTTYFARPQNNMYVVGDFSQSIYAWRGADYRNMMQLKKDFAQMREYRLEQNYRSTQTILDAATQVISHNTDHPVLALWTDKKADAQAQRIPVIEAASGEEEARQILEEIKRLTDHSYRYQDVVILYRTNAQSRPFEEAFVRAGIPYTLVGGFKFYERKEIKDLLAYLRLVVNPQDNVSQERITKLGKRRAKAFTDWQLALHQQTPADGSRQLSPPLQLLQEIIAVTSYLDFFNKEDPEDISRLENIQELLNVASQFDDPALLLENIALVQDEYLADTPPGETKQAVTLMSLHAAKGLEYPVVFMVGMEEGLLPHSRSLLDPTQMSEERRLAYVGITRAQDRLYFSYARRRWLYGSAEYSLRSRFLGEIEPQLLRTTTTQSAPSFSASRSSQQRSFRPVAYQTGPTKKSNSSSPSSVSTRRLIVDDSQLDAFLQGEMDMQTFLRD